MHCVVVFRFALRVCAITDDIGLAFKLQVRRLRNPSFPNQCTRHVLVLRKVCLLTGHASEFVKPDADLISLCLFGASIHSHLGTACLLSFP